MRLSAVYYTAETRLTSINSSILAIVTVNGISRIHNAFEAIDIIHYQVDHIAIQLFTLQITYDISVK